jgi:quercetin dioxygenase-like cupin family protein
MKKFSLMIMSFMALALISQLGYSTEISTAKIPEVTRTIIQRTDIAGSDEELRLMLVAYPPGYASPAHIHPVVGLNYILEGTAESQYEGEDLKTLNAGDSYQDPANKKHLVFRNSSKTDTLRFLVAYRIKKDGTFMHPL